MEDWNIGKLPFWGKFAVSAFLCAAGIGYLFATVQLVNAHGKMTYANIVRGYYGTPAQRDSIDAYWASVQARLVEKWNSGERGAAEAEPKSTTFSLEDLDVLEAPSSPLSAHDKLLSTANSLDQLKELIEAQHESDLQATLGLPTVASLVSLGHIHTFGHIGFLMPVMVLVLLSSLPWKMKGIIASVPMIGVIFDYPSALLTRLYAPEFALLLILAGALTALGFLLGFLVGMYDLWVKRS